ncbi:MAG TPA: ATP synthase F1 subunit delta [Bacteroidia bacterium]|nr:ATP synthase F1 subunit delta [Bacteroidia bacterium]
MAETKVSRRYAKSLLDLGRDGNSTELIYKDMLLVSDVIKSNRQLAAMLKSPVIHAYKKDSVLKEIFGGKIQETSLEFMRLVTQKNREYFLEDIVKSYLEIYKDFSNIQTAYVTTATPLDAQARSEMSAIVKKATGRAIELIEEVDPSIIGGFILRWGDNQIDSSVTSNLGALKQNFSKTFIQN